MMLLVSALLAVCVMAYPPGGKDKFFFRAAGPGDARSPCPGLNALANHGYINRNGRNIKGEDIISAASAVYNIAPSITGTAVANAKGIFINDVISGLDALNLTHNRIEHDASLSRSDYNLGDWVRPNATLISQFLPNVQAILTRSDIAAARRRRITDSQNRNPEFTWGITNQEPIAAAESTFLHTIFGNNGQIPAAYLKYFLSNEALPTSLGWSRPSSEIGQLTFLPLVAYYTAQELMVRDPALKPAQAESLAQVLMAKHGYKM